MESFLIILAFFAFYLYRNNYLEKWSKIKMFVTLGAAYFLFVSLPIVIVYYYIAPILLYMYLMDTKVQRNILNSWHWLEQLCITAGDAVRAVLPDRLKSFLTKPRIQKKEIPRRLSPEEIRQIHHRIVLDNRAKSPNGRNGDSLFGNEME